MKHRPPGLLRPRVDPDVILMIATAGHVDHGKTQLVKLLTGCSTDRLKEERERGLTIELGFAPCLLRGTICAGIVDVPGHEKFVKTMVAGVSGIDMAILVIAADDGIMPQTVEHFQIMHLLGVRNGMIALTKTDLVPAERVERVSAEIRSYFKGTFLDGAPLCPVSSETLEGFSEFHAALVDMAERLARRQTHGVFRMPVLNVFRQEGFGLVITGIPVDGRVAVGDEVEVVPGNRRGKIRGIQRFLRNAEGGGIGQCLALNIGELSKQPPKRGHVVCRAGYLTPVQTLHLAVTVVHGTARPLRNAEPFRFHAGTSDIPGKLYVLEGDELGAGQKGLATFILAEPLAAAVGDKFILRRSSPAVTVAGGEVLACAVPIKRPRKRQVLRQLTAYLEALGGADPDTEAGRRRRIAFFLASDRETGASAADISRATLLIEPSVAEALADLLDREEVVALAADHYVHAGAFAKLYAEAAARIEAAVGEGKGLTLSVNDFRRGLDWPGIVWSSVEKKLAADGLMTRRGDSLVLETAFETLTGADRELAGSILALYAETGFRSPRPAEVPERLAAPAADVERLLEYLCTKEKLLRLTKNVVVGHDWVKKAQDMVVALIREKGVLNSADFKYHIDSSRKYALAILDFFDARRVTRRIGNDRQLAPDFERNLL